MFLAEQHSVRVRWGMPASISVTAHVLTLILILMFFRLPSREVLEPLRVLEIRVMSRRDLAVKGTGRDFHRGPMPDKTLVATPPKTPGPVVPGSTPKVSYSVTPGSQPKQKAAPKAPPKLSPMGPLFGRGKSVSAGSGIGREKVYVPASAVKLAGGSKRSAGEKTTGEGLVGVPGEVIDLTAKRGGGGSGGVSSFLGGEEGLITGGAVLQRRGESILEEYPSMSQAPITQEVESVQLLKAPDTFFSIRGPLKGRKILEMKLPKYPRWAEEEGIEAQISVQLIVTPEGKVKPDTWIEYTSGIPEFDQIAVDSVLSIKFAPLSSHEVAREQWGIVTFNFRLKHLTKEEFP